MSEQLPAVTVVVPTRNRVDILGRTLASIFGQRGVDLRVIVVDDGSSDGTAERIESLGRPDVRVIRRDDAGGVASARNVGTAACETQWVSWCDDDDRWAPAKLRAQIDAIASNPGTRWASSSAVVVDVDDRVVGVERGLQADEAAEHLLTKNLVPAGGSGVLAERALFDEVGGFDEQLALLADWDLWTRFALAADVAHVDRPHVAYLRHPSAMSRALVGIDDELEIIRRRYAFERTERGVVLDEAEMVRWTTWQHVRARRTGPAFRGYLRMATRHRQPTAVAKALSLVFAPGVARRRDGRPIVPDPAWPVSEGAWFEDTTSVWDEPRSAS